MSYRKIGEFPDYEVDDVEEIKGKRGILKQYSRKDGYRSVKLYRKKFEGGYERKGFLVHRLVAQAFIPNPDDCAVVNHKDGNKSNNSTENLEWCTYQDNTNHAHENKMI